MTTTAQFPDEQTAGAFVRQGDAFDEWAGSEPGATFPAVAGRYHLYVSLACPWAHRTIIVRQLKGLQHAIGMTVVDPIRDDLGWRFGSGDGLEPDPINGWTYLAEAYRATDPQYHGRVTVPTLWDTVTQRIVSNNDDHIMRMFETGFEEVADAHDLDFYPLADRAEIDALNETIYETVNNGVYRAGFATDQAVYETAAREIFATLDTLERRLADRRFLFGATPVETDWRLFVTLIRFDAVYVGHFKCNLRRIVDYPNLWGYVRDLYQFRDVASTVNFDHIKRHYYLTHDDINPAAIVPIGPELDFGSAHGRDRLG